MRHKKRRGRLGKQRSHRDAMLKNMVRSLFRFQRIQTTKARAKEARRLAEKLITLSKQNDLTARRRAFSMLRDRDIVVQTVFCFWPRIVIHFVAVLGVRGVEAHGQAERLVFAASPQKLNGPVAHDFCQVSYGSIRLLLENKYIYQPFWDFHSGRVPDADWEARFKRDSQAVQKALGRMNTKKILAVLFERLFVLRNQLVHGGSTWNSSVNRNQMRDGANLMGRLVPIIIFLILENGDEVWGDPSFPVVDD